MAEPSRVYPVKHLSNFVGTTPSLIHPREEFSKLKNILQKMPSGTLRHALSESTLGISGQNRTECRYWVRFANRRDQDGGPCRAHVDETIKVSRLDSNMSSNAVFSPVLPGAHW